MVSGACGDQSGSEAEHFLFLNATQLWNLINIHPKLCIVKKPTLLVAVAFVLIVVCEAQESPRSATESAAKASVEVFYNLIVNYRPLGLPEGESKQSILPLLSSRLRHNLDLLQSCQDDYDRRYLERDKREHLKSEIWWAEDGLFSGANEAAFPSRFSITRILPKPNHLFEVHLRFTYINTEPNVDGSARNEHWDYKGIVFVVFEDGRYLIDNSVPLSDGNKPYASLSQEFEGCKRGKWVGIDYKNRR